MIPVDFIPTKITIPLLKSNHIKRSALIDKLNKGLKCNFILISACAGSGKSTLISKWVAECKLESIWYSIDSMDNSISGFFSYFIGALQKIDSSIGENLLASIQSNFSPHPRSIMTILINKITELNRPFIFVLDDLHHINTQEIIEAIHFLIMNIPPLMHLVIITREDTPFPLSQLRVKGKLLELKTVDLRFDNNETNLFCKQNMEQELSPKDLIELNQQTDGWITGLQLALLSLKNHKNRPTSIKSFSGNHQYVFDYLMEEVFEELPDNIKVFLMKTSILNKVCISLGIAVIGQQGIENKNRYLEDLLRSNLFIIPLDHQRNWFRYNNLFKSFLFKKLLDSGLDVNNLHTQASCWLEDNGFLFEAFQHSISVKDLSTATRLITTNINLSNTPGVSKSILSWLQSLSIEELQYKPDLLLVYVTYSLINGQTSGVEEILNIADKIFQQMDSENLIMGQLAIQRSTLELSRYNFDKVKIHSKHALNLIPEGLLFQRCTAKWMLGMAYLYNKDLETALNYLSDGMKESTLCGNSLITVLTHISLGQIYEFKNLLYRAENSYKEAISLSGVPELSVVCEAHLGLARLNYQWNNLRESSKHAQLAMELANQYDNNIDRIVFVNIFIAKLKRVHGDLIQATGILSEVEKSIQQKGFKSRIPDLVEERIFLLLENKEYHEAKFLAQKYNIWMLEIKILLMEKKAKEALALIELNLKKHYEILVPNEVFKIELYKLLAYYNLGNIQKVIALLKIQLPKAREGGLIRIFIDEGKPMETLLQNMVGNIPMFSYIKTILKAFENESKKTPPSLDQDSKIQSLIEPLTPRELDVLGLVAQGYSNKETCDELYMALDTVKGHNRRIFQKLHVENRIQAINSARNLQLIS